MVVRHRVSDPGEGAETTPVPEPSPRSAARDPARRLRSQPRDVLRLAHLHRSCWRGRAPPPGQPACRLRRRDRHGRRRRGVARPGGPGQRARRVPPLAEYRARFADRVAIATAAAAGGPALAQPSRIIECRRCPWWPVCGAALEPGGRQPGRAWRGGGEAARGRRAHGRAAGGVDPAGGPPSAAVPVGRPVALARAWQRDLAVVRRMPGWELRADVEVDVDMESFGESGAYLWGALLTPAARPPARAAGLPRVRHVGPAAHVDEARSFAGFWEWLSGVRGRAAARPRFRAYCYNEHAENRWLLGSAQRFAGRPGVPHSRRWRRSSPSPWDDLFGGRDQWFLCARGKGLKRIAPAAGSAGATRKRAGRTPCAGTAPVSMDSAPPMAPSGCGCWSTTRTTSRPRMPSASG